MEPASPRPPVDPQQIYALNRPESTLLFLYLIRALLSFILFPIVFPPLLFRYLTLRYRFDDEGIHMSYGILFRKENLVRYARIQDLHLSRGLIQRWLGLATIEIQTASGAAGAELSIEGFSNYEAIRDFLYSKMRGARFGEEPAPTGDAASPAADPGAELLTLLTEIRDELRALRRRS